MNKQNFSEPSKIPVSEQLLLNTVRITTEFGLEKKGHGTGFLYRFLETEQNNIPCLVTNKHVIKGASKIELSYRLINDAGVPIEGSPHTVYLENTASFVNHPDENVDLCILPIASILKVGQEDKSAPRPFFIVMGDTVLPKPDEWARYMALDDVVMIGYPDGLWDSSNNLPIARKGIISTLPKYDYCGKHCFLVDMACLKGSSGSPVFLFDKTYHVHDDGKIHIKPKIKLLGVLSEGPEYEVYNEFQDVNSAFKIPILNLGVVIKSDKLKDFEPILDEMRNRK